MLVRVVLDRVGIWYKVENMREDTSPSSEPSVSNEPTNNSPTLSPTDYPAASPSLHLQVSFWALAHNFSGYQKRISTFIFSLHSLLSNHSLSTLYLVTTLSLLQTSNSRHQVQAIQWAKRNQVKWVLILRILLTHRHTNLSFLHRKRICIVFTV